MRVFESEAVQKMMATKSSFAIGHWHGDELGILHLLKPYHVACIVSTSKDGDIMNKAIRLLGGETVRGSSTRGGTQALKGILSLKSKGWRPSVAVDGPKGPIYKVKPGVLQISRLTNLPIVPISFHSSRHFIFKKSWNQSKLPLPFARVTVYWGEPMPALSRDEDPKNPELAQLLEQRINDTKKMAAQLAANTSKRD